MWSAFHVLATKKTPAISGQKCFSLPLLAGLSMRSHAGDRSQSRSAAPLSHAGHVGSSRNPVVMSVANADRYDFGPFSRSHSYQHWLTDTSHWDTLFQISGAFNADDLPLWTELVTPEARADSFPDNRGCCLHWHGADHSFKRCPQPFIKGSRSLNPQRGQLGDYGEACRRWQQRMRSYQRRDTRSLSSYDRRTNFSRRNDNNRNRNNHGGKPHEPPRNISCNNGQGNFNHDSSSNAAPYAPLLLGQDARNAGNMPQSLTVYQPNTGTPPPPTSGAGTTGICHGATLNANNYPNARQWRPFRTRIG